jgi:hypothetical protein
MGMDCIPLNKSVKPFHANWGGWTFILRALLLAGADLSEASGSNDGQIVSAETAMDWAKRLRELLSRKGPLRLRVAKYPDALYHGGYNYVPVVDFTQADVEQRVLNKLQLGWEVSIQEQVSSYAWRIVPKKDIVVEELSKEDRKFLLKFARFCERSGGFAQC